MKKDDHKEEAHDEYGGIETLSGKEKAQFFVAMMMVVMALIAFYLKIYFF